MAEAPWSRSAAATALRAETVREIKQTARRVLVEQGVDGLALRAVAREMGMTAPALYRYFDSREDLVEHVVADLYDELSDVLEAARDAAGPATRAGPAAGVLPRVPRLGHHPPRRVRPAVRQRRRRRRPAARRARGGRAARPQLAAPAVRRGVRRPGRADLPRARVPGAGRRRDRARRSRCSCGRGARSSRSRCRSASCRCSCPAGSGSTAWSAWRSSVTCASPWTTRGRCSRRSCAAWPRYSGWPTRTGRRPASSTVA